MTVTTSNARHVLFRLGEAERLPDALLGALRDEVVLAGWMRASGVLHDVKLRAFGGSGAGSVRTLTGAVHVIVLDGSIGLAQGDVTCGLRAVLARETESGLETLAGEIVEARIGALEVMVTALDDVTAIRESVAGGAWLLDPQGVAAAPAPARQAPPPPPPVEAPQPPVQAPPPPPVQVAPPPPPTPAPVVEAAPPPPTPPTPPTPPAPEAPKPPPPKPSPSFGGATGSPMRPARPAAVEEAEQPVPDAGDVVEHFAFGRCEVVKSDGDRLHLRLGKDGRIKEIALEMLRVTPLPPVEGQAGKHFKLDRKL